MFQYLYFCCQNDRLTDEVNFILDEEKNEEQHPRKSYLPKSVTD